jgi:hypothetical protein
MRIFQRSYLFGRELPAQPAISTGKVTLGPWHGGGQDAPLDRASLFLADRAGVHARSVRSVRARRAPRAMVSPTIAKPMVMG